MPVSDTSICPLRCGACQQRGRPYAPRFGDVVVEYFARRYEVVDGQAPPPFVIQIKCSNCNGFVTIRERHDSAA